MHSTLRMQSSLSASSLLLFFPVVSSPLAVPGTPPPLLLVTTNQPTTNIVVTTASSRGKITTCLVWQTSYLFGLPPSFLIRKKKQCYHCLSFSLSRKGTFAYISHFRVLIFPAADWTSGPVMIRFKLNHTLLNILYFVWSL